jgi:hypothetical protein
MRGTSADENDDVIDTMTPVAVDVPISIVQTTNYATGPETGRLVLVQYADGIVRPRTDVRKGDRLRDQGTGQVYVVDSVSSVKVFMQGDLRLKMRLFD